MKVYTEFPYDEVQRFIKRSGNSSGVSFGLEKLSDKEKDQMNQRFRDIAGDRFECRRLGVVYSRLGIPADVAAHLAF